MMQTNDCTPEAARREETAMNLSELYRGLAHIAIYTRDMDESIRFYERIGGALRQKDVIPTPEGDKHLCLVEFAGFLLELIQPPVPVPMTEGCIPHIAVYVDDVDAAAAALRAAGVDSFMTEQKVVVPNLFGGLENWFFTGPSGEQIELLHML